MIIARRSRRTSERCAAHAATALARGDLVVLLGNGGSGGLVLAADRAQPDSVAQLVRVGVGFIRVAILDATADRLNLPLQWSSHADSSPSRYCVSVDARHETTTGISAHDRAATLRALADPSSTDRDLTRPGHVVPLRVGLHPRTGYRYEHAAIDLARAAGIEPAVAFSELASAEPGRIAADAELADFARTSGLAAVSVDDVRSIRTPFPLVRATRGEHPPRPASAVEALTPEALTPSQTRS